MKKKITFFSVILIILCCTIYFGMSMMKPSKAKFSKDNYIYVNKSFVKVRKDASNSSEPLYMIPRYSFLKITDITENKEGIFYKVEYFPENNKLSGWLDEKYIDETISNEIKPDFTGLRNYIESDLSKLLGSNYKNFTISSTEKATFTGNERIKARAIYLNVYSIYKQDRLDKQIAYAKKNNLNAFVIDIKDDAGTLLFETETTKKYNPAGNKTALFTYSKIKEIVKKIKDNGIYPIARIVTFKDLPYANTYPESVITYEGTTTAYMTDKLTKWITPHNKEYQTYLINYAKEAVKAGFREIQFDYVRFPDILDPDINLDYKNKTKTSKPQAIANFVKNISEALRKENVYVSADVFGITTTAINDAGIGQYWEAISSYADYICPMVYPSHYEYMRFGVKAPDLEPYKIIYNSIKDGMNRNKNLKTPAVIRPWLQSFTAIWLKEHKEYTGNEIKEQVKALKDLGIEEFILWNSSNRYPDFN